MYITIKNSVRVGLFLLFAIFQIKHMALRMIFQKLFLARKDQMSTLFKFLSPKNARGSKSKIKTSETFSIILYNLMHFTLYTGNKILIQ